VRKFFLSQISPYKNFQPNSQKIFFEKNFEFFFFISYLFLFQGNCQIRQICQFNLRKTPINEFENPTKSDKMGLWETLRFNFEGFMDAQMKN